MKIGIVLSGGGSKGAYQIGFWKALKKLHIKYDIVTGTSVGALNAALMTQKTYYKGLYLWENLSFEDVIDEKINEDITTKKGKHAIFKTYAKGVKNGGISVMNLEKTIDQVLNIKKIYRSKVDMGIVIVKAENLRPILLTKKQISPNDLKNYLIASASCFPAFKKKNIDNTEYIDGGFFDNLPINLAIDMGAEEIIAVDLKEIGIKRRVKNKNIKITTISPRNDIGSFLVFDSDSAKRAIRLGYNDTMKTFNRLDGFNYTFKKNHLHKNYLKYNKILINKYEIYFKEEDFIEILERLGSILEIDDSNIYSFRKYNKLLKEKFLQIKSDLTISNLIDENNIKQLFSSKIVLKYIYDILDTNDERLEKVIKIFYKEYEEVLYLKCILEV